MAATLEFVIKGIALIYPSSADNWIVLLPFKDGDLNKEQCHDVKITYGKKGGTVKTSEILAKKGRKINIIAPAATSSRGQLPNIFKLTDGKAHGHEHPPNGKGIRKKNFGGPANNPYVEMTIPNATIDLESDSEGSFVLLKYNSGKNEYTLRRDPATIVSAIKGQIMIPGTEFKLKIADITGSPREISLDAGEGGTYLIEVDNDCLREKQSGNDFNMVYECLVEDKKNKADKFELEWVPLFITDVLKEGHKIDKDLFNAIQSLGRKNLADKAVDDPTYPCFVYGADGVS